ncbi:MAG: 4'-phosphopantetheinyl transferase superfamily protein [Bacteroidales bacterium]|nr:4'-phosphopantetheinyl transferase superfamily protein [Bacteroidales bacterium]
MPFLREINPAKGIRAGIWHITETTGELLADIQLSDSETNIYNTFRNELRKRQWLAYRAILKHFLAPLTTFLSYDHNGKPSLDSGSHHISVSHAGEFAAAVCSETVPVGIDIEKIKDRVNRVKERFLQHIEMETIPAEECLEQLYVYWGGKEALYKLNGKPDVDFRNDIYIHPFDYLCNTNQTCKATLTTSGNREDYTLSFQKIEDYMLVVAY